MWRLCWLGWRWVEWWIAGAIGRDAFLGSPKWLPRRRIRVALWLGLTPPRALYSLQARAAQQELVKRMVEQMAVTRQPAAEAGASGRGGGGAPAGREHRFWSTQPVRQFGGGGAALEEDGAIDAPKTVEDVRKTPLKLPPAFEWSTCDVNDSEVLKVRTERHCWDRVRRTACSPAAPSIHLRVYTSQCWDDEGWGLTGHIPSHMTRPGAARHLSLIHI